MSEDILIVTMGVHYWCLVLEIRDTAKHRVMCGMYCILYNKVLIVLRFEQSLLSACLVVSTIRSWAIMGYAWMSPWSDDVSTRHRGHLKGSHTHFIIQEPFLQILFCVFMTGSWEQRWGVIEQKKWNQGHFQEESMKQLLWKGAVKGIEMGHHLSC